MSSRWIEGWFAYARERFPLALFAPLSLLLVSAGLTGGAAPELGRLAHDTLLALGLLFQFRLWDDLADRARDRREHPERVLCRAPSLAPYQALLAVSAGYNLALVCAPSLRVAVLAGYLGITVLSLAWYQVLRPRLGSELGVAQGVLVKYALFVGLLGAPGATARGTLVLAAAALYLCFAVYEILHDARLHRAPHAARVLAVEMAGFGALLLAFCARLGARGDLALSIQGVLCLATGLLQIGLYRRWRAGAPSRARAYLLFALCFAQFCSFNASQLGWCG